MFARFVLLSFLLIGLPLYADYLRFDRHHPMVRDYYFYFPSRYWHGGDYWRGWHSQHRGHFHNNWGRIPWDQEGRRLRHGTRPHTFNYHLWWYDDLPGRMQMYE